MQLSTIYGQTVDLRLVEEAIKDSLYTVGELQYISYSFEQGT